MKELRGDVVATPAAKEEGRPAGSYRLPRTFPHTTPLAAAFFRCPAYSMKTGGDVGQPCDMAGWRMGHYSVSDG